MSIACPEQFERARERVLAGILNPESRQVAASWLDEREALGKEFSTLLHEANVLRNLSETLYPKAFAEAEKADILRHANRKTRTRVWRTTRNDGTEAITTRDVGISRSTRAVHNGIIKAFYRWLRDSETYPPEVRWLSTRRPRKDSIPTDQLIGRDELKRLLQAAPDVQDKAILAVLHEGGFRASELCAVNVGNVHFDQYGAVIMLPKGAVALKTGARRVRLFDAVPHLHAWYEAHPRKADPSAPLFYSRSRRRPGARYVGNSLYVFCKRAGERAGLHFATNPHLFRHSAATEKARLGWNEHQMRAFFGWSPTSDMPSLYVHLAGGDYERMELRRRGLVAGDVDPPGLMGLHCASCGAQNNVTARFCVVCRHPLTPEAEGVLVEQMDEGVKRRLVEAVARQLGLAGTG